MLEINSVSLLVGSVGTNPVITGLVGITLAGVAGQDVWFLHRGKKKYFRKSLYNRQKKCFRSRLITP